MQTGSSGTLIGWKFGQTTYVCPSMGPNVGMDGAWLHCNKKWAKRSFPLENNPSEEGKFPCWYWNICPATHTVIIHSSVREKCSRIWTGTFYWSNKVNFLELSLTQIFSGKISGIPCFSWTFPENSRITAGRMFSLAHPGNAYSIRQKT